MSALLSDLRVLLNLLKPAPADQDTHAARLNAFYEGQALHYDDFRRRLLAGREEAIRSLDLPHRARVVDLGGGTGANLEFLTPLQRTRIESWQIVDLCRPLLTVAAQGIETRGDRFVSLHEADATTWQPEDPADVVVFSYSLTMMPDWVSALENAWHLLKPGGQILVVDFYVSRKHVSGSRVSRRVGHPVRHGAFARHFWPAWFAWDNVFLSPDHLPWLEGHFEPVTVRESMCRLPFLPGSRVPWYRFTGRKVLSTNAPAHAGPRPAVIRAPVTAGRQPA